ncbi:hypothetical protein Tco_0145274 [Tanacetum coccineum]
MVPTSKPIPPSEINYPELYLMSPTSSLPSLMVCGVGGRFLALGWHFEEIHVPWDHLEKQQTRLRLYTKNYEEKHTAQAKRLLGNKEVWVEMHRGITWDKVENSSPQNTQQVLPSFEEYTLPVTYLKEVEETLGTPIEVETLDETQLEDLGLNTCNHNIPLSDREVPSFDELKPQPQPLPNFPSLDVNLGDQRGPQSPIKPHSSDSFRMKEVDSLTIHTPPSPYVASFHPKDKSCYYHPCLEDPKKHYGFKPGLLGRSKSLGVDFSNWEMIEDDWELVNPKISLYISYPADFTLRVVVFVFDLQVIFDEKKLGSS